MRKFLLILFIRRSLVYISIEKVSHDVVSHHEDSLVKDLEKRTHILISCYLRSYLRLCRFSLFRSNDIKQCWLIDLVLIWFEFRFVSSRWMCALWTTKTSSKIKCADLIVTKTMKLFTSAQIIQSKEFVYAINQASEMTMTISILIIGVKKTKMLTSKNKNLQGKFCFSVVPLCNSLYMDRCTFSNLVDDFLISSNLHSQLPVSFVAYLVSLQILAQNTFCVCSIVTSCAIPLCVFDF